MNTRSAFRKKSSTNTRTRLIGISRLRRSLIYQPLAILMSILLLPAISWMDGGDAGPRPFQAAAQIISGCDADPSSTSIIRKYCVTTASGETFDYHTDLIQLENDAVSAYLAEHGLPPSDAHLIYDLGRSDLRSAVRANMLVILESIINKAPADRAQPHEQNLYNWLSTVAQNNEIALYTNAINEFDRWQSDPCLFTLDPVIASAYNLSYDGVPFCAGTASLFNGPPVPDASYFRAYGFRKSYGAPADQFPYFSAIVAKTSIQVGAAVGIAGAIAWLIAAGTGATIAAAASGISLAGTLVSGSTAAAIGAGALIAGPVLIVLVAIAIGVTAGLQAFTREQTLNDLNNMTNTLNQVKSDAPDLLSFLSDSSGFGGYKIQMSVVGQTVPEVASTGALPTHQNGVDVDFAIQQSGSSTTTVSPTLGYKDWDGNTWSAQTSGGWFVQSCSGAHCSQADSIIGSIEYVDWSGVKWTAARFGTIFVSTKAQPASTDKVCKADSATGITPGSDFSNCSSYVSTSIPLTDSNGNFVRVSFSAFAPPVFSSPGTVPFAPGVGSSHAFTATGNPTPTICFSSGNLPAGFNLNGGSCGQGSFQLAYDGSAVPQGAYNLTLTASGYGTPVTETFTVAVTRQLSITSANTFTPLPGVPVNFLVTTTGYPAPSLSLDPNFPWPAGLTFKDNHDGTATISGTLSQVGLFACGYQPTPTNPVGNPCGIIASNSQGTVEQAFSIDTILAPQASVVPPTSATFIAGIPNQIVLSSFGAITPVTTWAFLSNVDAPWATLQPNVFDRTATLSGAPPAGTTGSFTVYVAPFAQYSASDPSLLSYTPYTITVNNTPVFTTPNTAAFAAGTFGSFPISVNMGTVSLPDTLPNGLSFLAGSPGSISGVAAPGTGGQYMVRLIDDAGAAGSATQDLTVDVYEGPQITSPNTATFVSGTMGSFAVTTTGFPSISTHPVASNSVAPTSPAEGNGMYFTVTGLPADLQASNLTPQGFASGTLTIEGTPSAADAGPHQVQIIAENGVGMRAQQTLTIKVINIAGPAPVSGTKCNGYYNGTFNGNITVSSGQNCSFVEGGGVTGNVAVNGGNFTIAGGTIKGNVQIQGSAAFSVGPFATISGNVNIQNVASASTTNQVCGSKVGGSLQLYGNATATQIGSAAQDSCPGNSVAKNVAIQRNTGLIAVYNNAVEGNLSCSSNTSITGGGNTAQKESGQCSTF
jgi:hypothetical protein